MHSNDTESVQSTQVVTVNSVILFVIVVNGILEQVATINKVYYPITVSFPANNTVIKNVCIIYLVRFHLLHWRSRCCLQEYCCDKLLGSCQSNLQANQNVVKDCSAPLSIVWPGDIQSQEAQCCEDVGIKHWDGGNFLQCSWKAKQNIKSPLNPWAGSHTSQLTSVITHPMSHIPILVVVLVNIMTILQPSMLKHYIFICFTCEWCILLVNNLNTKLVIHPIKMRLSNSSDGIKEFFRTSKSL